MKLHIMKMDLYATKSSKDKNTDNDKKVKKRWEQAEELCKLELIGSGFEVKDERQSGCGYDFLARKSECNEIRYVEVKRLKSIGHQFKLTRTEFTQAKK